MCSTSLFVHTLWSLLGYLRLLREGRAPMASPDPLSVTSDESCNTPDLEILWFRSDDAAIIVSYFCDRIPSTNSVFPLLTAVATSDAWLGLLLLVRLRFPCVCVCVCRVWLLLVHYQIMSPVRWRWWLMEYTSILRLVSFVFVWSSLICTGLFVCSCFSSSSSPMNRKELFSKHDYRSRLFIEGNEIAFQVSAISERRERVRERVISIHDS